MPLQNQSITAWQGEDFTITLGPFTDSAAAAISLTGATATLVITSENGAGTTHVTKTVGSGITISSDGTTMDVTIDGSADTDSISGKLWWECKCVLANSDELQLIAPSRFTLDLSAI
jgi:hypothetical protein